jgi:Holliday junction resolvase-like predicted endonuclease
VVLGGISLRLWFNNFSRKRAQKKRFKRGVKLEKQAAKYLTNRGFTIMGEQLEYQHTYFVNSEEENSTITIDYLVEKDEKLYVVEVKSGKTAISIKNRSTRRQLLEYAVAIECDGVYLLDMENKTLKLIEFNFPNTIPIKAKHNKLVSILILIIIALSITVYYYIPK